MAYIRDTQNAQKDKKLRQGQVPASQIAPIAQPGAAAPTPASRRQSGRFTNVQKYLGAQEGAGGKLALNISSDIAKQTQDARQKLNEAKTTQQQAIQSGGAEYRPSLISAGLSAAGRQDQPSQDLYKSYQDYENTLKQGYQGPSALSDTQVADIQAPYQQAQERAAKTETEAGRFETLKDIYGNPKYTTGQSRLDQLLLALSPEARKRFEALRTSVGAMPNELTAAQEELAKGAQQQQTGYDYALQQIQKAKGLQVENPIAEAPAYVKPIQQQTPEEIAYQENLKRIAEQKKIADAEAAKAAELKKQQDLAEAQRLQKEAEDLARQKNLEQQQKALEEAQKAAGQEPTPPVQEVVQPPVQEAVPQQPTPEDQPAPQQPAPEQPAQPAPVEQPKLEVPKYKDLNTGINDSINEALTLVEGGEQNKAQVEQLIEQRAKELSDLFGVPVEEIKAKLNAPQYYGNAEAPQSLEQFQQKVSGLQSQLGELQKQLDYVGSKEWQAEREAARAKYGPQIDFLPESSIKAMLQDRIKGINDELQKTYSEQEKSAKPIVDPAVLKYAQQIDSQIADTTKQLQDLKPEYDKIQSQLRSAREQNQMVKWAQNEIEKAKAGKSNAGVGKYFSITKGTYYTVRAPDGKLYTSSFYGYTRSNGEQVGSISNLSYSLGSAISSLQRQNGPIEAQYDKLTQQLSDLKQSRPILPTEGDLKQQFQTFQQDLQKRVDTANQTLDKVWGGVSKAFDDGVLFPQENPELYEAVTGRSANDPNAWGVTLPSNVDVTRFISKPQSLTIADFMTDAEKARYVEFSKLTEQEGLPVSADTQVGSRIGKGIIDIDRSGLSSASKNAAANVQKNYQSNFDQTMRTVTGTKLDGSGKSLLDDFDEARKAAEQASKGNATFLGPDYYWNVNKDKIVAPIPYFVDLANKLTSLSFEAGKINSGSMSPLPTFDNYLKGFDRKSGESEGQWKARAAASLMDLAINRVGLLKERSGLYPDYTLNAAGAANNSPYNINPWTGGEYSR